VVGTAAVLEPSRAVGVAVAVALVVGWAAGAGGLPDLGFWGDVALTAVVLIPVTFAVVWLALPLHRARGLILVAAACGALAWALDLAGAGALFNAAKLLAFMLVGFWFLELFEELWWIVLVAVVIPWVDAFSVWRGPTKTVVEENPDLFTSISVAFRLPGEDASANIGPPDVLFFALFLASAARFGLRVAPTFLAMVALLGLTVVLSAWLDLSGLPALPAVALGFLLPNADLIWARLRRRAAPSLGDR